MTPASPTLVRAIGRWTLTALVINGVIGSGIYGLPDDVARMVGSAAPFAYLAAALGIGIVMSCFAEVSSQFTESGGPYLYARTAFGPFVGAQVGWAAWLTRLTSGAAMASLFVVYLGEFWPGATAPVPRTAMLVLLLGGLTAVNVRGVRLGATLSNVVTIAKLAPMVVFALAGFALVGSRIHIEAPRATGHWFEAILALTFAFGGFETAVVPGGEVRDARRDAPVAFFVALAVVAAIYLSVHLVVMGAFPDPADYLNPAVQDRPVGEASRVFLGTPGAMLVSIGVLLSSYGALAVQFLSAPRLTYALAEHGDFPRPLASIHPRFRTPYISIVMHGVLVGLLAAFGGFIWNALLAAVARLITYVAVCGAVPKLRAMRPDATRFRLPAGVFVGWLGMGYCLLLLLQMRWEHAAIVATVAVAAAANWAWARRRTGTPPAS